MEKTIQSCIEFPDGMQFKLNELFDFSSDQLKELNLIFKKGDTVLRFALKDQSTAQLRTELTEQYATIENLASRIVELEGALRELNVAIDKYWNYGRTDHYVKQITAKQQKSAQLLGALKGGTKE